ncbi:hypothetical protein QBZ16_000782 [Prototheca wickerhamii]|uniref:Uncharacterized protein n=1 Tax=Prototheca wickerhamii TaxID=3111 RepID=A0AAD9MN88_PROWI|nr:hypothetical protein QBZ16_000782 [Prototheca wickerhamii]
MGRGPKRTAQTPFQRAVEEAEKLQQRAERRNGLEALAAYSKAAAFKGALESAQSPSPDGEEDVLEAWLCLAECYQNWGDAIQSTLAGMPDAELSEQVERDGTAKACALYARAVETYGRAPIDASAGAPVRADAAVNCANTLTSWAEVAGSDAERLPMLERAVGLYRAALAAEPDALTWSNLADAEVAAAVALAAAGDAATCERLAADARASYLAACELSSSEQGDDLPGLLCNWGAGLTALAGVAAPAQARRALLDEAALRLREAAAFDRGDPAPLCALGDALAAAAEIAESAAEGARLLEEAAQTGRPRAWRTRGWPSRGSLAAGAALPGHDAASELRAAIAQYGAALARPEGLGGWRQRADVRYNHACALALAGDAAGAAAILKALVSSGAVDAAAVTGDPDLAGVVIA